MTTPLSGDASAGSKFRNSIRSSHRGELFAEPSHHVHLSIAIAVRLNKFR